NQTVAQRLVQRLLIYNRPACGVDEKGARFHQFELWSREQMARLWRKRDENDEKVRLAQQGREFHRNAAPVLLRFAVAAAIGVEHVHVESLGSLCHLHADAPQTENPQRSVVNVTPKKGKGTPWPPAPLSQGAPTFSYSWANPQNRGEGEVRRGLGQHAWLVRQQNSPASQRRNIDVVIPHRHIGHDLEPGCVSQ